MFNQKAYIYIYIYKQLSNPNDHVLHCVIKLNSKPNMHDVKKQQSQAIDVKVQKSLFKLDER